MTRRLLLRSSLISFFLSERIFFSHLLSFFAARASFSRSLSLFLLWSVDIISAAAFHGIDPSRMIGAGQQEETRMTTDSDDENRDAILSGLCC